MSKVLRSGALFSCPACFDLCVSTFSTCVYLHWMLLGTYSVQISTGVNFESFLFTLSLCKAVPHIDQNGPVSRITYFRMSRRVFWCHRRQSPRYLPVLPAWLWMAIWRRQWTGRASTLDATNSARQPSSSTSSHGNKLFVINKRLLLVSVRDGND
jgi:hypothetical protein